MVNHWRFQGIGTHPSKTPVANEQQVIIITRDTSKLDQSLLKILALSYQSRFNE